MERERLIKLQDIEKRMKLDNKNYQLYVELGDFYADENINKSYLCYEHSLLYCDNDKEKKSVENKLGIIKKNAKCQVHPTTIIILSYKSKVLLENCINSIKSTCYLTEYKLVIVENGLDEETIKYLKQQDDITVIFNKKNVGFPAGCNQGIAISDKESDVMLLNNDTVMCTNSLFWLRMGLYEDERTGACGSVTNYAINEQIVYIPKDSEEEYEKLVNINNSNIINALEPKNWLVGFALLIKRRALNEVGLLDEIYTPGNFEDVDLGIRLGRAGYMQYLCHNSYIIHIGSQSFGKDTDKYEKLIDNNIQKFIDKWTDTPENVINSTPVMFKGRILSEKEKKNLRRVIDEKRDTDFWNYVHSSRIKEDMGVYNELVCSSEEKNIGIVLEKVKNPEYVMKYRRSTELTLLIVYISIYEAEKQQGIQNHIFSNNNSLKLISEIYTELKYALWRVIFIGDTKTYEEWIRLIHQHKVSDEYIIILIMTSAMNQVEAYYIIGYLMRTIGKDVAAIKLYNKALEILPDDEMILCELSDVFWQYGKVDVALEYMKRITHPTNYTEKYLKKWERQKK